MNLPQPKLGNVTAITITTTSLDKSLEFYKKLGFAEVQRFDFPFKWLQVSDGSLLIMLIERSDPYIALTYYVDSTKIDALATELETGGVPFISKPASTDMVKRYIMQSPDKLKISLVANIDNFFKQPPGPTMLTTAQTDYFNPAKYVNKLCGMYGEFAHPVADLEKSILFWEKLGFAAISKFTSPYPWAILSDGLAIVGLHQTKSFDYPAITYFAADMKEKIAALKAGGLKPFKETGDTNIVVKTPEGQFINLFKLGM